MAGPPDPPVGPSGATTGSWCLVRPYSMGGRRGEKKAHEPMGGAVLAWAREALSGSAAVDARSEGPDCVRSAVEKRHDHRVWEEGLAHAATQTDSAAVLGRLHTAWEERGVALQGSTTAGAALSPEPMRLVCGDGPPPLGPCQRITALPTGVWNAVAPERARLARSTPQGKRGRPSSKEHAARRSARKSKSLQQHISAWFHERFRCVKRQGNPRDRQRLLHMPRGRPQRRTRREIMAPMDALLDRRCRTQTALATRKQLRPWVQRFPWRGDPLQKGCAPPLEKALTVLDATRLPATAHAVERGNRRHRTMQKRVDRVRSTWC